jgi:hypothetical protein
MINPTRFILSLSLVALSIPLTLGQDLSSYRGFQLGMTLTAAAKQAGLNSSDAKTIYQRPALIQELEWRPRNPSGSSAKQDPVDEILFSFYSGQLYRIVVSYDQDRTEGLTDEDLIQGISAKYGTPTTPVATIVSSPSSQVYSDSEKVLARWEDSQNSLNLFRFSYRSSPGMLVYSKKLDVLAQAAVVQALRMLEQEAPQRELDRQKKQDDEKDAASRKVRPVNKANFRP